jgi:large subunit ribosomal protein L23
MTIYDYILAPVITEKSFENQKINKYSFYIRKGVGKIAMVQAITKTYGVQVKDVNILKLPAKSRLIKRGRSIIKRPQLNKAIVTLKKGQTIDFSKIKDIKK